MAEVVSKDEFRQGLIDALAVIKALSPHCKDFVELVGLIELAVGPDGEGAGNGAQLRILMAAVLPPAPQGQRR